MSQVARSEAGFLTLVRGLVDGTSPALLAPLLADRQRFPARIGPSAAGVLQSTLARGTLLTMARSGASRRESRPVEPPELRTGTLWERIPPQPLHFTRHGFALLRWAYTEPMLMPDDPPRRPADIGTGDRVVALLLARALVALDLPRGLAPLAGEPLVQLAYPWFLPDHPVGIDADFVRAHGWMIEGLHDVLAQGWVDAERAKATASSPEAVLAGCARQDAVLHAFLDALEALDRTDLADVLLTAGERLVPSTDVAPDLGATHHLDSTKSLRLRTDARRASAVFLVALGRVRDRLARDRTTRFFDDDYEASQARLVRWERFGDRRAELVRRLADTLLD